MLSPEKVLEEIRRLARELELQDESDAFYLATNILALDKWISGGTALPKDWADAQEPRIQDRINAALEMEADARGEL